MRQYDYRNRFSFNWQVCLEYFCVQYLRQKEQYSAQASGSALIFSSSPTYTLAMKEKVRFVGYLDSSPPLGQITFGLAGHCRISGCPFFFYISRQKPAQEKNSICRISGLSSGLYSIYDIHWPARDLSQISLYKGQLKRQVNNNISNADSYQTISNLKSPYYH